MQEPSSGSQSQCLAKITDVVWLLDDGSCVNWNMLEQLLHF